MKRVGKPVFFIVLGLVVLLTYAAFFGVSYQHGDLQKVIIKGADQIRWGIDIRGGVDVTFSPPDDVDASETEMSAAESVIKTRLVNQNITDYEVYTDFENDRVIVRFPWKSDEENFDPEAAIEELGKTALLTFRKGLPADEMGQLIDRPEDIILTGADVAEAGFAVDQTNNQPLVTLKLKEEGKSKFAKATQEQLGDIISIWMDDQLISYPTVNAVITDGQATITGQRSTEEAIELANQINGGALPFQLKTQSYKAISPTLGAGAKDAMVLAGAIAFGIIVVLMLVVYRVPGLVASICLLGQVTGMIAGVTGFFALLPSFTLTLPGIAGIILSIGFGVDANIVSAERIREEIRLGRSVDRAIQSGFEHAFSAIFDSNITVVFIAIILMGVFGPPNSVFAVPFNALFNLMGLGAATAGSIYSFGYTLLIGVLLNFLMGVLCSRLMLRSIANFKAFRNPWLYGGEK